MRLLHDVIQDADLIFDLARSREFAVLTPDARVVVHGTEFTVRIISADFIGAPPSSHTCVEVKSGVVRVERLGQAEELTAGHTSGCSAPPPLPAPEILPTPTASSARGAPPATRHARAISTETPSNLAEQNRLFEAALQAERSGQTERARALVEHFLADYPASPLATDAHKLQERLSKR